MRQVVKKVKYIHILANGETKFNPRIVKIMSGTQKPLNREDHLFVTPHEKVFNYLAEYDNIILDKTKENLVNKYADSCDWIIYHGHLTGWCGLKIKNKYIKKLIPRFWGENVGFSLHGKNYFQNSVKKFLNYFYLKKMSHVAAMGITNKVDEIVLREKYPYVRIYRMPYSNGVGTEGLEQIRNKNTRDDEYVNVILGHSGWPADRHTDMLKQLSKYKDKIKIYVPMSYGNAEYIKQIENFIEENCADNVKVVKEFMEYEQYAAFLNKMDIAILCGRNSYALGNIALLLFFGKKIFLNRDGIIKAAFDEENLPYSCIDEIENMSYDEFVEKAIYPENIGVDLLPKGKGYCSHKWEEFYKDFS